MNIPEGYNLHMKPIPEGWRARLVPEGYVNKWSRKQPVEAEAPSKDEALAKAKWALSLKLHGR